MMFVFESQNGNIYKNPYEFILNQKNQQIKWGTELKIYPVICEGNDYFYNHDLSDTSYKYQTIKAMFYHERNMSGPDSVYWLELKGNRWYDFINNIHSKIIPVNLETLIRYDTNENHIYFKSQSDLQWYAKKFSDII